MKTMSKTPDATIVRIPPFKAVSSGYRDYEGAINTFMGWLWSNKIPMAKILFDNGDFILFNENEGNDLNWVRAVQDSVTELDVAPYKLSRFEGGLYAVAPSIDGDMESILSVVNKIHTWIQTGGFVFDENRGHLNMKQLIYLPETDGDYDEISEGLGFVQNMIYVPVIIK